MSDVAEISLSELERDALTEVVNVGVSRAAASLRRTVGAEVLLSVPSLDIIGRRVAAAVIGEREVDGLVAVRQFFSGAYSGRAMLIFPQGQSLGLVRAVAGGDMSAEDLVDRERETLAETGKLVLDGCLASMADVLQRSLDVSAPDLTRGSGAELFTPAEAAGGDPVVLFLHVDFRIGEHAIRCYLAMLMDVPSLSSLQMLIARFIASVLTDHGDAA